MKSIVLFLFTLLVFMDVSANDQPCEAGIMQPKMKQSLLMDEAQKPAKLTVAETRVRLKNSHAVASHRETEPQDTDNNTEADKQNSEKVTAEAKKKESRLGGIFDILMPSKLRNPVK